MEKSAERKIFEESDKYLNIPYIKPNTIELREYQKNIIESIDNKNTLVVLPTGLGKTIIAVILSAMRLNRFPSSNILVLAPTKPLVNQHAQSFRNLMDLPDDMFIVISGSTQKSKRKELWNKKGIFFATPQTVKNDLEDGIVNLNNFSLLVFDEAHRSVGDYAYTYIAREYISKAQNPLILGLTASPGGEVEKIGSVVGNLFIENVEVRSYNDPDVLPYIKRIEIEWIKIEMPPELKQVDALLKAAMKKRVDYLLEKGFLSSRTISKKELLEMQKRLITRLKEEKSDFLFYVQTIVGQLVKINYALELVETQGLKQFVDYYEKLREEKKTKSSMDLLDDDDFTTAYLIAKKNVEKGIIHPKLKKIREIVNKEMKNEKSKMIIFTQYVETAKLITEEISDLGAVLFIGQRRGYTQKKQMEIIKKFSEGKYRILVATSVAEEGLDIPAVDYVVFYEPIPSEIRSIQRRGRTGRFDKGKVIILMTQKSLDEAYYWASIAKERNMRRTLHLLKRMFSEKTKKVSEKKVPENIKKVETLQAYTKEKKIPVVFDYREQKIYEIFKSIVKENEKTIIPQKSNLSMGDVIINNRIVIERKSAEDFLNSIIDGRLFSQLDKLIYTYELPILIVEGNLYDAIKFREIHENVIRGVLSKIVIDYNVPIIWTRDVNDSAQYIYLIARREMEENKKSESIKIMKKSDKLEKQIEVVVSALPSINVTLAKRILKKFKTIRNLANAKIEQLKSVEGIGDKKAEKIYSIFNTEYKDET